MQGYNVKIYTFPNGVKQYRLYERGIDCTALWEQSQKRLDKIEYDPFENHRVHNVKESTFDEHFRKSAEVSLKRTKQSVYFLARSNIWDWFVTFTLDPKKVDRFDFDECVKVLSKWLNNLRRSNPDMSYIIVPERHKSGAWHFHGLMSGLSPGMIQETNNYVIKKWKENGRWKFKKTNRKIYKFSKYKLGFMTATKVQDNDKSIGYITKYYTKEMLECIFGRKRYWASRNLEKPREEVYSVDWVDKMVLAADLESTATYKKDCIVEYGQYSNKVSLYEV
jgi:hypothetical protein